jgi:transcriptional regulator with XRE-family HTH domain
VELSERIKRWREGRDLSKADVARSLNIHLESVLQWENGSTTPTTDNLHKFVESLGITMEQFYGRAPRKRAA